MLHYFPTGKGCNQIHRMCTKGFVSFDFPVISLASVCCLLTPTVLTLTIIFTNSTAFLPITCGVDIIFIIFI